MNKSIRCAARDANGHRCNRKAGHETFTDPPQPKHSAYGKEF